METLLRGYHMNKKIGKYNTKCGLDKYIWMSAIDSANRGGQALLSVEEIRNNLGVDLFML